MHQTPDREWRTTGQTKQSLDDLLTSLPNRREKCPLKKEERRSAMSHLNVIDVRLAAPTH